jgi:hypothetical protein
MFITEPPHSSTSSQTFSMCIGTAGYVTVMSVSYPSHKSQIYTFLSSKVTSQETITKTLLLGNNESKQLSNCQVHKLYYADFQLIQSRNSVIPFYFQTKLQSYVVMPSRNFH